MTDPPRRGRPRPPETITRDREIYQYLQQNGPQTRNDLARVFGLTATITSLALTRLQKEGQVRRCLKDGENVWTADVESPCP